MIEIGSHEDAQQAVAAVAKWLETEALAARQKHPRSEPPIAKTARQFARELLDAAYCDGLGGCELCQG